jgi:hypothetical protein
MWLSLFTICLAIAICLGVAAPRRQRVRARIVRKSERQAARAPGQG